MELNNFDTWYKILHLLILAISATFVLITIRKNQEWNRRRTTHEMIHELVTGDYPELSKKLTVDFEVQVYSKTVDYLRSMDKLDEQKQKELRHTVTKIFNLFEVLSISIKNGVIDDQICFDYLGMMYTEYYRWGIDFIEEMRQKSGEKRILLNFQNCALRWKEKIDNGIQIEEVKGKNKL